MQKQDFIREFQKLLQCFIVPDPKEKAEIYFYYLQNIEIKTFSRSCDQAIRTCNRFPSIAKLLEIANSIPKKDTISKIACDLCDGDGRISKEDLYGSCFSYRCTCENGKRFLNFPLCPTD